MNVTSLGSLVSAKPWGAPVGAEMIVHKVVLEVLKLKLKEIFHTQICRHKIYETQFSFLWAHNRWMHKIAFLSFHIDT